MAKQVFRLFRAPCPALAVDGGGRHDNVGVEMEIKGACVGVQHGDSPRCALQRLVVLAKAVQRVPGGLHEQAV